MDQIILEILQAIRTEGAIDAKGVDAILAAHNKLAGGPVRAFAKKHVMPFYLKVKSNDAQTWEQWGVTPDEEAALVAACRMKPRRTSSGVATITVITKPWKCSSNCLYCPNDIRMPKSYLSNEPACQRAERNWFDPYLQVASRLRALMNMGHDTSKVELIILGGTFCDYPSSYQTWFVEQLFSALNDHDDIERKAKERRDLYRKAGIPNDAEELERGAGSLQALVNQGKLTYNQAIQKLYHCEGPWQSIGEFQVASMDDLHAAHKANESGAHRVVGLVVETRPDTVTPETLTAIRRLGCTKVQVGIQSLDPAILALNQRATGADRDRERECIDDATQAIKAAERRIDASARAIDLIRLFGFKVHTHFMVNLPGSSPEQDKREYARFMTEAAYQPDEVKIYPCSLVAGTGLEALYRQGGWRPYGEQQLIDVLAADVAATPEFCRISRMIRDISAQDILAGNKKGNLRQLVDREIECRGIIAREIRCREINSAEADLSQLALRDTVYETLHTTEHFLQWVTPQNQIAGFLRLSLPCQDYVREHEELSVSAGQAMIREVHVYGRVAHVGSAESLGNAGTANAQHAGLGRKLIERACQIAREAGYTQMNVISSIGTREYYRKQGFADGNLYQTCAL